MTERPVERPVERDVRHSADTVTGDGDRAQPDNQRPIRVDRDVRP
jgi:hypothetical protein